MTEEQKKAIWDIYADAHDRIGFSEMDFAIKQAEMITVARIVEIMGEDIKFKSTRIPDAKSFIESIEEDGENFEHVKYAEQPFKEDE